MFAPQQVSKKQKFGYDAVNSLLWVVPILGLVNERVLWPNESSYSHPASRVAKFSFAWIQMRNIYMTAYHFTTVAVHCTCYSYKVIDMQEWSLTSRATNLIFKNDIFIHSNCVQYYAELTDFEL